MAKRLFVGSLAPDVTSDQLRELFSQVGPVDEKESVVIMDRLEPTVSRGFGFIEYVNDEDATVAIEKFNNYELNGKNIVVNEARAKRDDDSRGSFGGGRRFDNNRGSGNSGGFGGGRRDFRR